MDQDQGKAGESVSDPTRTPEQIEADIERTRGELGDTVEALAAKTDVKARAHAKADELKEKTPDSGRAVLDTVRANPAPIVGGAALIVAFLLGRRSARP
jgi:hypothetical protein